MRNLKYLWLFGPPNLLIFTVGFISSVYKVAGYESIGNFSMGMAFLCLSATMLISIAGKEKLLKLAYAGFYAFTVLVVIGMLFGSKISESMFPEVAMYIMISSALIGYIGTGFVKKKSYKFYLVTALGATASGGAMYGLVRLAHYLKASGMI
jgi:hypothetical protein